MVIGLFEKLVVVIGLDKMFIFFCFFRKMALVALVFLSLTSSEGSVRLYCHSCHISMHLKKKASELVYFCVAILTLKIEEKNQHFGILCFIISRKVKTQLKLKKKICAQRKCYD